MQRKNKIKRSKEIVTIWFSFYFLFESRLLYYTFVVHIYHIIYCPNSGARWVVLSVSSTLGRVMPWSVKSTDAFFWFRGEHWEKSLGEPSCWRVLPSSLSYLTDGSLFWRRACWRRRRMNINASNPRRQTVRIGMTIAMAITQVDNALETRAVVGLDELVGVS